MGVKLLSNLVFTSTVRFPLCVEAEAVAWGLRVRNEGPVLVSWVITHCSQIVSPKIMRISLLWTSTTLPLRSAQLGSQWASVICRFSLHRQALSLYFVSYWASFPWLTSFAKLLAMGLYRRISRPGEPHNKKIRTNSFNFASAPGLIISWTARWSNLRWNKWTERWS